jgi:hypothetical protein
MPRRYMRETSRVRAIADGTRARRQIAHPLAARLVVATRSTGVCRLAGERAILLELSPVNRRTK